MTDQIDTVQREQSIQDPIVSDEFHVHDDDSANWVIRKIVEAREYSNRCAEWCDRERARAKREEEFFMFRYGQQLFQLARQQITEGGGRRKSVGLPAGTIGFRSEPAKLVIDDESAVVQWAKANLPEAVVVTERLSKSTVNQHLEQTGEIPAVGAHIEPAREKFYIK